MKYLMFFLVLFTASTVLAGQQSSLYLLTSADANSLYGGFQYALANSQDHQAVDWTNPVSGLNGSTVPIKSYQTSYGQTCREYLSTVQLAGAAQQAFGTACRQADGSWKIAGEKPVKRQQQGLKFVYLKQPRQQVQQTCLMNFKHPPGNQVIKKQYNSGKNYHNEFFHEKLRTFKRGGHPAPHQRRIERQQPSRLLKLVAY